MIWAQTRLRAVIFVFFVLLIGNLSGTAQTGDAPGTSDHPLVNRYEGSWLVGSESADYDSFTLVLGPAVAKGRQGLVPSKKQDLEGKVTRLLYVGPHGRSSLEAFRNYRDAFRQAGFDTLFTCSGRDCGRQFLPVIYPSSRYFKIPSAYRRGSLSTNIRDPNFMAARRSTPEGTVYVSVFTALHIGSETPNALIEIVEMEPMDSDMASVNAETMAESIKDTGHIALYGIYFDVDSAQIKPESTNELREIADLLRRDPSLRLLVVGHTDNQGDYDYNMDLSRRRADAVVRELVSEHGVQNSRLKAAGVGYLSPVASNDADDGRARNRRVELVKQ